jgi:hypothetical protein
MLPHVSTRRNKILVTMDRWQLMLMIIVALSLPLTMVVVVRAEPHPHRGKIQPFQPGTPAVTLSSQAISILQLGKPYQTQMDDAIGAKSGRGMVVQDVHAPIDVVWATILDFNNYKRMVPKTIDSEIYYRRTIPSMSSGIIDNNPMQAQRGRMMNPNRRDRDYDDQYTDSTPVLEGREAERIRVRMKVGFPLLKLQFFVDHIFDPANNSMTWTLDYNHRSDLDDSVGYWYVVPHPNNPTSASRVYYSVDVQLYSWIPSMIVEFMKRQALTDATAWVKKYSELAYGSAFRAEELPPSSREMIGNDNYFRPEGPGRSNGMYRGSQPPPRPSRAMHNNNNNNNNMENERSWWKQQQMMMNPPGPHANRAAMINGPTAATDMYDEHSDGHGNSRFEYKRERERGGGGGGGGAAGRDPMIMMDRMDSHPYSRTIDAAGPVHAQETTTMGSTRLILVSSVFALSLYNIHLYFSH